MRNIVKLMGNSKFEANLTYSVEDLDSILSIRFLVARLGESPRLAWWDKNLDATDLDGGGSFFQKLLPSDNQLIGEISAMEAIVSSAKEFEWKKLKEAKNQSVTFSIFIAPPYLESELSDRIFHLKRFPSEISDGMKRIINLSAKKDTLLDEFKNISITESNLNFEGTTFGIKLKEKVSGKDISVSHFRNLVCAISLKKGEWSFPYYE